MFALHQFVRLGKLAVVGLMISFAAESCLSQVAAFPGALGFGANATGGRNGTVYHVTTLADSGTGSFRDAVSHSGRTIVFDVGGMITLNSAVSCASGLTIAGQTAPGGICFNAGEVAFAGRNNIICRFIRVRPGSATTSTGDDCLSLYQATNCILDHCSLEFGPWNNIDAVTCHNISIQSCIDANPIGQQFGAHTENVGAYYAWTYNLFANSHNRNPLAKINTVFINNVDYNCSAGYTTHTSTRFSHDIVNNYFVAGPASGGDFPWYQMDKNQSIYYAGNYYDSNDNGSLDGSLTTPYWYQGTGTVLSSPWSSWTTVIPTVSAALAWRYDVSTAGAFPRDEVDSLVVSQVKTLGSGTTGTGVGTAGPSSGLYTSQAQTGLSNNGYGTTTGGTAPANFTGDGLADYWKLANGLNTNTAYPLTNTVTGYTLLENYLNFLAGPHAVTQTNTPVDINLSQFTAGFSASAAFSLTNAINGTISLVNGTNAHFVPPANFSGLGAFNFTVAESGLALSAVVTVCVTPVAPPASATGFNGAMVVVATNSAASATAPPANLTWHGDGTANVWNFAVSNWLNGVSFAAFKNGDVATFDDTGANTPGINLNTTVSPGAILFNDNQNYTLAGSGALSGSGSFSKTGTGTVTVGTTNSGFTGSINLGGGTLLLNTGTSIGSGAITLSGGSTLSLGGGSAAISIPGAITVPAGENVNINSGYVANGGYGNFVSGDSTSVLNFNGSQSFGGANSSQFNSFNGTIYIASGSIRFSTASSGNTFGSLTPNFIINGTLQPRNAGNTIILGALNGSGQLQGPQSAGTGSGSTVFNIGGANQNAIFTGTIVSNANSAGSVICVNKLGTGTQTLTGNNSFGGTNAVLAGTLLVNGANTPSLTTVFTNATLGGSGSFSGPVIVNSGGMLSPGPAGNGSIGTLTISNNLTLNSSATLNFDLTSSPGGANDLIYLPGGLLTMVNPQNYNFNLVNNALGAGTYVLITGGTNTSASGVSFVSNLPGSTRQTFAIQRPANNNGQCYVQLAVTGSAAALVWSGTNGNGWDLATTTNWLNGSVADKYYNLDTVVFNDSAANGGVAISGTLQPAALLVSNNATSFTFSNGVLGGFTSLVKTGTGTLSLNASNAFTGGTVINGGTLNVNNSYALGAGPVTLTGGTLHFNSVGPGNPINTTGTNTLQASAASANIYAGFNLTGSGRLNLTIDGNNVFTPSGDWSGFSGYIYFTGSKWLRAFSQNVGSANAVWDLGTSTSGIYNQAGGYTVYLGALFGGSGTSLSGATSATGGTTTYVIGGLSTNCTFNGIISDNASPTALIKSGNATLTLTGSSTFTGGTTVNSGTLCVNSVSGSGTGTGDLEIFSGATLTGGGIIGSSTTIDNGATLSPGAPTGTLTITNNLTLNDNSLLQFAIGTNSDSLVVNGDLVLTGQLSVTNAGGFGIGAYPLFTCGGTLAVGNLALASAPAGYNYSFNTNTAGVVKLVVAPTTPPNFGGTIFRGTNLVFSGRNGVPLGNYYVLTGTNLSLPIASWPRVATNQFDSHGNFSFTNAPNPNSTQAFYVLQLP